MLHLHALPHVAQAAVGHLLHLDTACLHAETRQAEGDGVGEIEVDVATLAQQRTGIELRHALTLLQDGVQLPRHIERVEVAEHPVHQAVAFLDAVCRHHPAHEERRRGQQLVGQELESAEHDARHGLAARQGVDPFPGTG